MVNKYHVLALHAAKPDLTARQIADRLGCLPQYVHATARRNGLKLPRTLAGEINADTELERLTMRRERLKRLEAKARALKIRMRLLQGLISEAEARLAKAWSAPC